MLGAKIGTGSRSAENWTMNRQNVQEQGEDQDEGQERLPYLFGLLKVQEAWSWDAQEYGRNQVKDSYRCQAASDRNKSQLTRRAVESRSCYKGSGTCSCKKNQVPKYRMPQGHRAIKITMLIR